MTTARTSAHMHRAMRPALPRGGARIVALCAMFTLLVALLAATPVAARIGGGSAGSVAGVDARSLYDRVAIIGASASAGFGVRAPFPSGHPGRTQAITLARIAQGAGARPGTVTGDATSLFFTSPLATGRSQVDALLAAPQKPTLVLGVDSLFWFTYGALNADRTRIRNEAERLALLEVGLANLDLLVAKGIPVVVGDLPDMSGAVGGMLSAAQMPAKETLTAANARLRAWAAERPLVVVVPLAELVTQLGNGTPFQAGGRTWARASDGPLLQADHLHPTFVGLVALLARTEQSVQEHFRRGEAPGMTAYTFEHDPAKVGAAVCAAIEAELAARRATPADSTKPGTPGTPTAPAAPGTPTAPAAPDAPGTPAAPQAPTPPPAAQ